MTLEIKPLDEKPWDKDLRRFLNMVPNHGYVELVVLKAHLMIEELMWKLLELPLKKPNAINKKEFDFSHCLSLVEAIYWHEKTDWLWKAIRQINGIRNSLNRDWFAMGLKHMYEGMGSGVYAVEIRSTDSVGADPKPTLRVEYYPPIIDDSWTISSISGSCGGKTVYAYEAELWDGQPGVGTLTTRITDSSPSDSSPVDGSF